MLVDVVGSHPTTVRPTETGLLPSPVMSRRYFGALRLVAMLAACAVLPPVVNGDDATRTAALRQLSHGVMPNMKYSVIQPMLSTPFFWLLDRMGLGLRSVTLIPLVWLAVWCTVVWRLLRPYRSSVFIQNLLVLSIASLLGAYVIGFSSDIFSTLAISGGFMSARLAASPWARRVGWVAVVLGTANTPALTVALGVMMFSLVIVTKRVRFLLAVPAAVAVVALEASLLSGRLAISRYSSGIEHGQVALLPWGDVVTFGWPLWSGVLAVLFSFGRGLFFYLPLWSSGPSPHGDQVTQLERVLWLGLLSLIPVYATWWAWYGGISFGPRFFMIGVVPTAMASARLLEDASRSAARSLVLTVATALSVWVAIAGAVFGVSPVAFSRCVGEGSFALEPLCWYTPEYSALFMPLWSHRGLGARAVLFIGVFVLATVPTLWAAGSSALFPVWASRGKVSSVLRGPWRI